MTVITILQLPDTNIDFKVIIAQAYKGGSENRVMAEKSLHHRIKMLSLLRRRLRSLKL